MPLFITDEVVPYHGCWAVTLGAFRARESECAPCPSLPFLALKRYLYPNKGVEKYMGCRDASGDSNC